MGAQNQNVKKISDLLPIFSKGEPLQQAIQTVQALPLTLIATLFARFQAIWPNQWNAAYCTQQICDAAADQWARSLYGINQATIMRAIDEAANTLDYPPTIAKFRKICGCTQRPEIEDYIQNLMLSTKLTEEECRQHYRQRGFDC